MTKKKFGILGRREPGLLRQAEAARIAILSTISEAQAHEHDQRKQVVLQLSRRIQQDLDDVITVAITGRWGPYWQREDLRGRLEIVNQIGDPERIDHWILDGEPLAKVYPPRIIHQDDGMAYERRISLFTQRQP